jgi:hypothetical protein
MAVARGVAHAILRRGARTLALQSDVGKLPASSRITGPSDIPVAPHAHMDALISWGPGAVAAWSVHQAQRNGDGTCIS